jgi:hypothetical protein
MALPRPTAREKRRRYLDTQLPVEVSGVERSFRVNADFHPIRGTDEPWLFTSGLEGPLKISVQLAQEETRHYRVDLLFAETSAAEPEGRVFDVVI